MMQEAPPFHLSKTLQRKLLGDRFLEEERKKKNAGFSRGEHLRERHFSC